MFSIPRPNLIQSDEGFSVELAGPTRLLYQDAGKTTRIDSELLAGPSGLVIYESSITTWQSQNGEGTVDECTSKVIVDNVRRAFRYRGFEIQVM